MRQITEGEIRHYREHGFVHLPNLLDAGWLRKMEAAFSEEMFSDAKGLNHLDLGLGAQALSQMGIELLARDAKSASGRFWVRQFNWRRFPAVAELGCAAPLPEAIASLMGSSRLNFYGEQLFFKDPGTRSCITFVRYTARPGTPASATAVRSPFAMSGMMFVTSNGTSPRPIRRDHLV